MYKMVSIQYHIFCQEQPDGQSYASYVKITLILRMLVNHATTTCINPDPYCA